MVEQVPSDGTAAFSVLEATVHAASVYILQNGVGMEGIQYDSWAALNGVGMEGIQCDSWAALWTKEPPQRSVPVLSSHSTVVRLCNYI